MRLVGKGRYAMSFNRWGGDETVSRKTMVEIAMGGSQMRGPVEGEL